MIAERKTTWRVLSIIVAFMLVFTTVMLSTAPVEAKTVKPKKITLKATAKQVDVKGKVTVSVKSVKPAKASKAVVWKSSNKKIATVSKKGVVTGKKPGKVTITATSKANKKVKKSIKITVKKMTPTKVVLDKKTATLTIGGEKLKLNASVKPAGVYNKGFTWSSSDASVATVTKKGVVTAVKEGTAVITVKTKEKKKSAKCTVTVVKAPAKPDPAPTPAPTPTPTPDPTPTPTPDPETPDPEILMPYVMVGFYNAAKLNYVDVAADAAVKVWNAEKEAFEAGKNDEATILGNYVQMTDTTGDKKADLLEVVKYADGADYWDADMTWLKGVGASENEDPSQELTDEEGAALFSEKQRIPMGERFLTGWGLLDYSGTKDHSNLEESTYWPDYDYYATSSSETMTILPQFKTLLQASGWSCVMSSALTVLEYYGERGDLNENDLAALRSDTRSRFTGGTNLAELTSVFEKLGELSLTNEWTLESSFDNEGAATYNIYDAEWMYGHLDAGHPIMVIWNSYGGHGQVIIGYDTMGTEGDTADDVLIMMDPYDTTDHNADGYNLQSYQRLIYGLSGDTSDGISQVRYLVAYPSEDSDSTWENPVPANTDPENGGFPDIDSNLWSYDNDDYDAATNGKDSNKLNDKLLGQTSLDLNNYYRTSSSEVFIKEVADDPWIYYDENAGVGGPLAYDVNDWETEYNSSPFYMFFDFFNMTDDKEADEEAGQPNLQIIENYKTIQQSTEWACGCTSALMVMEHFGKNEGVQMTADEGEVTIYETDMSLSAMRQGGDEGATYLSGLDEIFAGLNEKYDDDWVTFNISDLVYDSASEWNYLNDKYALEAGPEDDGLIPYLISHDIPIMIGWDEWGGHWQTIIGYDDMNTPDHTQDDVIVLADSYDTTDHEMDGYVIESFERLVYGWNAQFQANDSDEEYSEYDYSVFYVAFPTEGNEDVIEALGLNAGAND